MSKPIPANEVLSSAVCPRQAASVAIQHDPELRAYYQQRRAQGKPHGTVLGAVCRKHLARVFVILEEQRPYVIRDFFIQLLTSNSRSF
jgi:hypothetical protein